MAIKDDEQVGIRGAIIGQVDDKGNITPIAGILIIEETRTGRRKGHHTGIGNGNWDGKNTGLPSQQRFAKNKSKTTSSA